MVKLKVTGMSCNHCVAAVTEALRAVPEVKAVAVDLGEGEATVEGAATAAELIKAIIDEGYGAEEISV
ncbi:MAG: cation transporter [Deltaproteobacteria bacterium]|nr:cation transporter [Deltaproteobacteria bacterium]